MAVKGVARFYEGRKKHIITTQTVGRRKDCFAPFGCITVDCQEHKCVLDSCRYLERHGFDVTYLPVQSNGLIDLEQLEASFRDDTSLVSVMGVNNEIGVVQVRGWLRGFSTSPYTAHTKHPMFLCPAAEGNWRNVP